MEEGGKWKRRMSEKLKIVEERRGEERRGEERRGEEKEVREVGGIWRGRKGKSNDGTCKPE